MIIWLPILACQGSSVPDAETPLTTTTPGETAAQPSARGSDDPGSHPLANVSHWLYLIDVNLDEDTVDLITDSDYDMVVIDFIVSEVWNQEYPLTEVIEAWHRAQHPKLVLAYIDIAEAKDYRTYWQSEWRVGDPDWIAGDDPDGWEGNYPVAYWYDAWREIWLGPQGYLKGILDVGFDGVYLDWVEAYSDENVVEIAEADGVDAVQEMIWWVGDIAEFGRARDPGFIVIAQNAAELTEFDEYVAVIDALAQEQVWFDGGADNDPPGDCPLPRTEADIDTPAYRQSLSPACRETYDDYPDSTLHVSSEEYLGYLRLAQSKGLIIFTVDYALQEENVTWVYRESRRLGFIPFVSNRALDRYVEPFP
jgi:cysteinyl-tRNA synthetase